MDSFLPHAENCIRRCRALAQHTEEPGHITRTFLSPPMRQVHADVRRWMEEAGMSVRVDAAGNMRGFYPSATSDAPVLFIGSHLDSVPRAGAFDGILGVVMAVQLIDMLRGRTLPYAVEVLAFSEEEGVRFGTPFIGSRAVIGDVDQTLLAKQDAQGCSIADAIRQYGLDPGALGDAVITRRALGYIEFHIEQGPVLESLDQPLGVVEALVGQSRFEFTFEGGAGHAGTTPMSLRRDALAGAAEWICAVEEEALSIPALVATVGQIEVRPGAANVIPGVVRCSLDVRHREDLVRRYQSVRLVALAQAIADRRNLRVSVEDKMDQAAVKTDPGLTDRLFHACAQPPHRMLSGAGHDAMILAQRMPAAMLFLRSPQGLSHHPDETVLPGDVAAALHAGVRFLMGMASGV